MTQSKDATLYLGSDSDSQKAQRLVTGAGISLKIIICTAGTCDFEPPMLISSTGVFDGLESITWYLGTLGHGNPASA